jgi:hypothetical protein
VVVEWAERGTVRQVEQLVRHHQQTADQERPPADPDVRRGLRTRPVGDGWGRLEVTLPETEIAEISAVLDAFMAIERRDHRSHTEGGDGQSARGDDAEADTDRRAASGAGRSACVDDETRAARDPNLLDLDDADVQAREGPRPSPCADDDADTDGTPGWPGGGVPSVEQRLRPWQASRANALVDLARVALAHADGGNAAGDDRYMLHLVARDGQLTTIDGTPVDPATAAAITCDASYVAHTVDDHGEPLHLGRKTKVWSTAQRRAVLVRDGGRCRFPGCDHRLVDIHHRIPWDDGGPTDIDNALTVCRPHHRLLHHGGFTTTPGHDGTVHFHRPDGTELATTTPAHQQLSMAA